jgi:hypothetical protein
MLRLQWLIGFACFMGEAAAGRDQQKDAASFAAEKTGDPNPSAAEVGAAYRHIRVILNRVS